MNNNTIKFSVLKKDEGKRLDILLSEKILELSRSIIKKIIASKNVKIDGQIVSSPSTKIKVNQSVSLTKIKNEIQKIKPFKISLAAVYEDKDILIVNKPVGMVVHPGAGNHDRTLVNALVYKYKKKLSDINGDLRPGIVHRIDKETSGLLAVAKNNFSHNKLGEQFSDHSIKRKYVALAWGILRPLNGKIETLISRNKRNRQLMAVSDINGKKAITNYKTLKVFNIKNIPVISFVEFSLETGRTHQIRVHMKYMGSPLLGDKQYGKKNIKFKKIDKDFEKYLSQLNGQALHAKELGFKHPVNNKFISFSSDLPQYFKKILNLLEKMSG